MSPSKFTKKPVTIDAEQWDGTVEGATDIIRWVLEAGGTARYHKEERQGQTSYRPDDVAVVPAHIAIDTLEGTMRATTGDYVIRGVKGEFYPCKPDIFIESYNRG